MPSRNTLEIIIEGDDRASKVIKGVSQSLDQFGKVALGAVIGGVAAATAAVAGFATRALSEFNTFEQGMTEVFTLLPNATQEAMDEMAEQIQYISNRFGTLPNEVIPAVYQALSAGVPQDNLFQFIETANKAAIAGVTTLETAVDGLTSVVNAYGSEVITAERASDIMFQTVLLGKTEFDELSRYLFQVIPTAASLGLAFEDVGAALATITAQGTPTSVATTQIRQLLVELQKPTTEVAKLFQEMSGKSFPDFIKEGGNLEQALKFIEDGAAKSGVELAGLFGSVEALNAFLGLTGNNADTFSSMLDQITDSAGSTDAAFQKMSQTMQFQINRLNSKISNLFINVGKKIGPIATKVIEEIGNIVSVFDQFLSGDMSEGGDFTGFAKILFDMLKPIKPVFDELQRMISGFFGALEAGVPILDVLQVYFYALLPPDLRQTAKDIITLIGQIGTAIGEVLSPIMEWVKENVKLQDVLVVIAGAIATVIIPAIAGLVTAFLSFAAPIAALIAGVALLRQAWESDFLGIKTFVTETLLPALADLADWFVTEALPAVINFINNTALPAIQTFFNWLGSVWELIRPGLESLYNWFVTEALPAIIDFIDTEVKPIFDTFIGILTDLWVQVSPHLSQLYDWFVTTGLPLIIDFVKRNAQPVIDVFIQLLREIWNTVGPGLRLFFNWFKQNIPQIVSWIGEAISKIERLIELLTTLDPNIGDDRNQRLQEHLRNNFTLPGSYNGMDYVPYNQNRRVHKGEAILTAEENAARMGNTQTNNISININGNYRNQSEANRDADMLVQALRDKGIDLSRA